MHEPPPRGTLAAEARELRRRWRALVRELVRPVEPIGRGALRLVWRLTDPETPASRERRRRR